MDWKIKALTTFAKKIKPGWRANALAVPLLLPLKLMKPRQRVAMKNIDIAFPELSREEKKKILIESYYNIIWTTVEILALQHDPEIRDGWLHEVEGEEHFRDAMGVGKGIIGLSGHVGNWELAASILASHVPITAIVRNPDNKFYSDALEAMRTRCRIVTIDKREPMIRGVSVLRQKEVFAIMPDQHGGHEGIMAPFFGIETSTMPGPAVFAYLTGAPIIPLQIIRLEPFKFKLIVDPPLKWEKLGDRTSTILDITVKVNKCIENMIRRAPGQYLWQHRRFKEISYG